MNFCKTLVEYKGQLVPQCNFWYLTDGLPVWVKIIYGGIILTGTLALGLIVLKLVIKKIIFHHKYHKSYSSKDILILIEEGFLTIILLGSSMYFTIQVILFW